MTGAEHQTDLTAAERIALAKKAGARIIASPDPGTIDPEGCAAALLRGAEQVNRHLGLTPDTASERAARETARQARILAALAAMRPE